MPCSRDPASGLLPTCLLLHYLTGWALQEPGTAPFFAGLSPPGARKPVLSPSLSWRPGLPPRGWSCRPPCPRPLLQRELSHPEQPGQSCRGPKLCRWRPCPNAQQKYPLPYSTRVAFNREQPDLAKPHLMFVGNHIYTVGRVKCPMTWFLSPYKGQRKDACLHDVHGEFPKHLKLSVWLAGGAAREGQAALVGQGRGRALSSGTPRPHALVVGV